MFTSLESNLQKALTIAIAVEIFSNNSAEQLKVCLPERRLELRLNSDTEGPRNPTGNWRVILGMFPTVHVILTRGWEGMVQVIVKLKDNRGSTNWVSGLTVASSITVNREKQYHITRSWDVKGFGMSFKIFFVKIAEDR